MEFNVPLDADLAEHFNRGLRIEALLGQLLRESRKLSPSPTPIPAQAIQPGPQTTITVPSSPVKETA